MTVPDHPIAAVRALQALHAGQERRRFAFDSLGQELSSAGSQNTGQGSSMSSGRRGSQDAASFVHGVSLSLRGCWQAGHHPRYAPNLTPSSPTFPHNTGQSGPVPACGVGRR